VIHSATNAGFSEPSASTTTASVDSTPIVRPRSPRSPPPLRLDPFGRDEARAGSDARAHAHGRDEADATESAVELVARPRVFREDAAAALGGVQERGEEREGEEAVRDGAAEGRRRAGTVDPLVVARALRERVHAGLVHVEPGARTEGRPADERLPIVERGDDGGRRGGGRARRGGREVEGGVRRERADAPTRRVRAGAREGHADARTARQRKCRPRRKSSGGFDDEKGRGVCLQASVSDATTGRTPKLRRGWSRRRRRTSDEQPP
jgi:hypothetical protein